MVKESAKDQWEQCTNGCINKRGHPLRHRGKGNCPRVRKAQSDQMNLSCNSIHWQNSWQYLDKLNLLRPMSTMVVPLRWLRWLPIFQPVSSAPFYNHRWFPLQNNLNLASLWPSHCWFSHLENVHLASSCLNHRRFLCLENIQLASLRLNHPGFNHGGFLLLYVNWAYLRHHKHRLLPLQLDHLDRQWDVCEAWMMIIWLWVWGIRSRAQNQA